MWLPLLSQTEAVCLGKCRMIVPVNTLMRWAGYTFF